MPILLDDKARGTALGVTAYLIWGVAALYWIQTEPVDPFDLLAHRALWSMPFVAACLALTGPGRLGRALGLLRQPRTMAIMAGSAFFGAFNWAVFLWAVTHQRATEASLGYFLVPLVNVAIGLTLFRESIDWAQRVAIAFALGGVLLQLIHFQGLPLVALALALSFGLYGAIRKGVTLGSMEGLLLETLIMAPFAIAWLWYRDGGGLGHYGLGVDLFLLGGGAYTAIPLMAYVAATRLLPLSALGLVFYIGPTTQLIVAVWVLDEPFDIMQLAAFALVWTGLAVIMVDGVRQARALRSYPRGRTD